MAEEKRGQKEPPRTLRRTLLDLAYHPRIPEGAYLSVVSVIVGLTTGLGAVFFIKLLHYTNRLFFENGREVLTSPPVRHNPSTRRRVSRKWR